MLSRRRHFFVGLHADSPRPSDAWIQELTELINFSSIHLSLLRCFQHDPFHQRLRSHLVHCLQPSRSLLPLALHGRKPPIAYVEMAPRIKDGDVIASVSSRPSDHCRLGADANYQFSGKWISWSHTAVAYS